MVNQHAVTGTDLRREVAQRSSGKSSIGSRLDYAAEQVVASLGHLAGTAAAALEAPAICSLRCFSPAASMARYRLVRDRHTNAANRPSGPDELMDCSAMVLSPDRVRT